MHNVPRRFKKSTATIFRRASDGGTVFTTVASEVHRHEAGKPLRLPPLPPNFPS